MVQSLLAEKKNQTRRTTGLDIVNQDPETWLSATIVSGAGGSTLAGFRGKKNPLIVSSAINCPYGSVGDRLWVRETWAPEGWTENRDLFLSPVYKADDHSPKGLWRPSIHMPRAFSRIALEITDIRIERLQSITAIDAIGEGIQEHKPWPEVPDRPRYQLYGIMGEAMTEIGGEPTTFDPVMSFLSLWGSINGQNSVPLNPWVWVVCFKRLLIGN